MKVFSPSGFSKKYQRYRRTRLAGKFSRVLQKNYEDAEKHYSYALALLNLQEYFLAYAEMRTAAWLGSFEARAALAEPTLRGLLPSIESLSVNEFSRLRAVASALEQHSEGQCFSVLDVGGGDGKLAAFLEDGHQYCLVEPSINGISGERLPFDDRSFSYVVSSHVLEHIPPCERIAYLDELVNKAEHGVMLLNPFFVEGSHERERLELIIDITDAEWAKEHLKCTLPKLDDVESYAEQKGLRFSAIPCGSLMVTFSVVFMDYFSRVAGENIKGEKINRFFNERFSSMDCCDKWPSSFLVVLSRD